MIKILALVGLIGLQTTTPVSAKASPETFSDGSRMGTTIAQMQPCHSPSERWLPGALQILQQEGATNQKETEYRRGTAPKNTDCAIV